MSDIVRKVYKSLSHPYARVRRLRDAEKELPPTKRKVKQLEQRLAEVANARTIQKERADQLAATLAEERARNRGLEVSLMRQARKITGLEAQITAGSPYASGDREHAGDGNPPPIVMIASGGSSGSHLLAQLLAAYEPFVIGPEPNIASRPDLFSPRTYRTALLLGLMGHEPIMALRELSNGYEHPIVPVRMFSNAESYLCESAEMRVKLLCDAGDWAGMVRLVRDRMASAGLVGEHDVLVEHSPSAAVSSHAALTMTPGVGYIHLVRDPRDAIASMMHRRRNAPAYAGISEEENLRITAEQWAFLTACALQGEKLPGYFRVSYEDLVSAPEDTMSRILDHLGQTSARKRDAAKGSLGMIAGQNGWRNSPAGPVSTSSIGRYRAGLSAEQLDALAGMSFDFPAFGISCSMKDFIDRFGFDAGTVETARGAGSPQSEGK